MSEMFPDKLFFFYFATGTIHAPYNVPDECADMYRQVDSRLRWNSCAKAHHNGNGYRIG